MSAAIKKIRAVESVNVSLNQGLAAIRLKPGNSVRLEQIKEIVERNGFTPKEAKIRARGEVISTAGRLQFKVLGIDQTYDLQADPKAGTKSEEIQQQSGKTLLIEGVIPPPHPPKDKKAPQVIQLKSFKQTSEKGGSLG